MWYKWQSSLEFDSISLILVSKLPVFLEGTYKTLVALGVK